MSLLNDMLRDLSQHKPVADGAEGYDDALLQISSITQKKQQPWLPLVMLFVVIFMMVISINYAWHKFSSKPALNVRPHLTTINQQSAVVNVPASKAISVSSAVVAMESVKASAAETPQETSDSLSEPNATTELQNHINDLLLQADRAISMDRLTSPIEDNAYGYYQKILSLNTNNTEAKDGLDRIASRYLLKAQEQISLGNMSQAEALIQRARFVSERYVQAHEISMSGGDNQSAITPNMPTAVDSQVSTPAATAPTETIKPFSVAEAPVVSVSPNAGWKDEQLAQHAQQLIQQSKQVEALALLKNFVATEQKPAFSAALLADLYIQQGNTQAADIIIEKASYLPADIKAKLKAQVLSASGDDGQAILILEKNLNLADNNESYRSLLASLYHKTANYQQSVIHYQRLINGFGEKPAYWLGLALAYDGLAQHKSALQAYQRLREYPQLQEQVKKYTDQRIAALRSE